MGGNSHLVKLACIFAFFGFQIHILTMAVSNYNLHLKNGDTYKNRDDVVQAFIIIAYACFIIGLILSLMMSRSGLGDSNVAAVCTAIFLFIAAGSVVIGLAVFNHYAKAMGSPFQSYWITTFTTGSACGLVGGILLFVALCC